MEPIAGLLPWKDAASLQGKLVSLWDSLDAEGSFFPPQLMALWLRDGRTAVMASALHTRTHFEAILRKMTVPRSAIKSRFHFVDAAEAVPGEVVGCDDEAGGLSTVWMAVAGLAGLAGPTGDGEETGTAGTTGSAGTTAVGGGGAGATAGAGGGAGAGGDASAGGGVVSQVMVVVDDLAALRLLGDDSGYAMFVCQLQQLVQQGACVVVLDHVLEEVEGEEGDAPVVNMAQHLASTADVLCNVTPLRTGYSKDIHGKLTITFRPRVGHALREAVELQYRVLDSSVKACRVGDAAL